MKLLSVCILALIALIACGQTIQNSSDSSLGKEIQDVVKVKNKVIKSDQEWRKELSPEEYNVLREQGTERPFTGDLLENKKEGIYTCSGCQLPLFHSSTKFESGTGWPSFYEPLNDTCITEIADNSYGWNRVEVVCSRCDGHQGHVFNDGPKPTGLRYCINSVSLDFDEK